MATVDKDLGIVSAYGMYRAAGGTLSAKEYSQMLLGIPGLVETMASHTAQLATLSTQMDSIIHILEYTATAGSAIVGTAMAG